MQKYKLLISYDGSSFSGWQVQTNAISIQTMIEETLSRILRTPTKVVGSGRTDSGVHALGQVAHFSYLGELDLKKTHHSLNGLLPKEIRILSLAKAPFDFHARYSAEGKIYRYHLHLNQIPHPFKRHYSLHINYPLDLSLLKASIPYFIGTKDFTSFSNEAHLGSASRDPVRTLHRIDLVEEEGGVYLEFEGDGFLYKMVRNIVGTLLDVARGKIPLETIPEIFAAKDRCRAGTAAPPHGLFLVKVFYKELQTNDNERHEDDPLLLVGDDRNHRSE